MLRKFLWLLLILTFTPSSFCQTGYWFNLETSTQFQNILLTHLPANSMQPTPTNISIDALKQRLLSLNQAEPRQPIVIQCNLRDYIKLLHDAEAKEALANLQVEFLNAHLVSVPLYLLGYADNAASLQRKTQNVDSLQIAFLTLPVSSVYAVEDADLLNTISEILSRPKNSLKIYHEREAYTAAKQLFEGRYHLVGIYEDEPSTLLDELQINLSQELNAHSAQILPTVNNDTNQLHEVSPNRLSYSFLMYGTDFVPIPAIVQETKYDFPILLSNVRTAYPAVWPAFSHALSDAYFLMVPEVLQLPFPNEQEKLNVVRAYLLNAYLSDPEDRYKSLGFLGYLLLMKDKKWDNDQDKDGFDEKCALFLKKLKLNRITAQDLFQWLNLDVPKIDKRDLFTDDVSRLYENALKKIDDGLQSKQNRIENFEQARKLLIAALLLGDKPKEVKGSRGLWSVPDYNPYYQLARVTLYLKEKR
jgi:hypothetical protein